MDLPGATGFTVIPTVAALCVERRHKGDKPFFDPATFAA